MASLLLIAVGSPVACIWLIHRCRTLEVNPILCPMCNHICHVLCKCMVGICSQVILARIHGSRTAAAVGHKIRRRIRKCFCQKSIACLDGRLQYIDLVFICFPVIIPCKSTFFIHPVELGFIYVLCNSGHVCTVTWNY